VTPRSPAQMSLVPDGDDQAARLEQFRVAHPDVPVLLLGACPRAWVGDQKVEHPTLRGLLDGLEKSSAQMRVPLARGRRSDR
jgi:hypothetical protein